MAVAAARADAAEPARLGAGATRAQRNPYDPIVLLSLIGRLFLVLAGGFFLRAMTEAGVLSAPVGIAPGESTPDGLFTLSAVECLASCGTAPMMQINDEYYEQLTEAKVDKILGDLKTSGTSDLKTGPYMWPLPVAVKSET